MRRLLLVLVASLSCAGCYLAHERSTEEHTACSASLARDCSPASPAPERFVAHTETGAMLAAREVVATGCDEAWALAAGDRSAWQRSDDGGESFRNFGTTDVSREVGIALGPDDTVHAVWIAEGTLFEQVIGSEGPRAPVPIAEVGTRELFTGPNPSPPHVVAVGPDGTLAVAIGEATRDALWVVLRDPAGNVSMRLLARAPEGSTVREARLCWAGARLVSAWERVDVAPLGSADVWGAIDDGDAVRLGRSAASANTGGDLDVACRPDGCGLVAWAERDDLGPGERTLGVARAAQRLETTASIALGAGAGGPEYPVLHATGDHALLVVQNAATLVPIAWDGTPGAPRSITLEGRAPRRLWACGDPGRDDAFIVGDVEGLRRERQRWALHVDALGAELGRTMLGVPGEREAGIALACTPRGTLLVRLGDQLLGWAP